MFCFIDIEDLGMHCMQNNAVMYYLHFRCKPSYHSYFRSLDVYVRIFFMCHISDRSPDHTPKLYLQKHVNCKIIWILYLIFWIINVI